MPDFIPNTKTPDSKKRLLVVSQHFWPETFRINDIVAGFLEDDIEIDVLCGLPNYPKGEWFAGYRYSGPRKEKYLEANVFRAGEIRRKGNTSLRIFLNYISFPLTATFNLPRLSGRKYDAIFCYETSPVMMMFPAIVYSKLHKVPLTTYVLDLWPENLYSVLPIQNKWLRSIAQGVSNWHYRRSNKLIAMSDALAVRLQHITKGKNRKISVIPQYCEDFYAVDTPAPHIKEKFANQFTILFTGNISPAQDLENLVDAMKILVDEYKVTNAHCAIIGDGMSRSQLEEYIARQNMQNFFTFYGQQPAADIPQWTHSADALFAGLLKSEDLSLTVPAKITSYFAAGRPMLVAADQEAARVAKESGAALVSPSGCPTQLADNILQLLTLSSDELSAMGTKGRACYQQFYNRHLLLQKLKDFIFTE